MRKDFELNAKRYGKSVFMAYAATPARSILTGSPDAAVRLLEMVREIRGEPFARQLRIYASAGDGCAVRMLPTARRR